jgi:hypothetical protein
MQQFASVRPPAGPPRSPLRAPGGAPRTTAFRIAVVAALAMLVLASSASAGPPGAAAATRPQGAASARLAAEAISGDPAPRRAAGALEIGAWCLVGVVVLVWLASDRGSLSRRRRRR